MSYSPSFFPFNQIKWESESGAGKNTWANIFLSDNLKYYLLYLLIFYFFVAFFCLKRNIVIFPFYGCTDFRINHLVISKKYLSFFPTKANEFYHIVKKMVADKRFIKSKVYQFFVFEMEISTSILNFFYFTFNTCTKHIHFLNFFLFYRCKTLKAL